MRHNKTIFISVAFVIVACTTSENRKSLYNGKKFTQELNIEGSTKVFLEAVFQNDSTCTFFHNEYESYGDKYYDYERRKKTYAYFVTNKHVVLTGMNSRGPDTIRLEISKEDNSLIYHFNNVAKGADGSVKILMRPE